jgi:hypothetical protein
VKSHLFAGAVTGLAAGGMSGGSSGAVAGFISVGIIGGLGKITYDAWREARLQSLHHNSKLMTGTKYEAATRLDYDNAYEDLYGDANEQERMRQQTIVDEHIRDRENFERDLEQYWQREDEKRRQYQQDLEEMGTDPVSVRDFMRKELDRRRSDLDARRQKLQALDTSFFSFNWWPFYSTTKYKLPTADEIDPRMDDAFRPASVYDNTYADSEQRALVPSSALTPSGSGSSKQ